VGKVIVQLVNKLKVIALYCMDSVPCQRTASSSRVDAIVADREKKVAGGGGLPDETRANKCPHIDIDAVSSGKKSERNGHVVDKCRQEQITRTATRSSHFVLIPESSGFSICHQAIVDIVCSACSVIYDRTIFGGCSSAI